MTPRWLVALSQVFLIGGGVSALLVLYDILDGHPQKMKVMNWVWPVQALYFGPAGIWIYLRFGRPLLRPGAKDAPPTADAQAARQADRPFWEKVFVGVTHCGAGCTLGDIAGEWLVYLTAFTIAGAVIWPRLILDFALAFALGIVFQYFSIAPMRGIHGWKGISAAIKADTLSLAAFEVGLFGWMLLSRFVFFGRALEVTDPVFWFMMQVGMVLGFATAFPVNWWLLRRGLKEAM